MNENLKLRILHIFFPNKCVSCHKIIKYDLLFCEKCETKLVRTQGKRCKTCYAPEGLCDCQQVPKFFFRSVSPFVYEDSVKNSLLSLKTLKNKRLARFFAEEISELIKKKFKDVRFDAIIPVPLHKDREKERGYNQSKLLCEELSKKLNAPVMDKVLQQHDRAKLQHTLDYKLRRKNVKGIYRAGGIPIECQRVLLVDDIMTSGSTLNECSKMLRIEGVSKIYCASVARTK